MVTVYVDNEADGVTRTMSDTPPAHFTVKIQSFSLLKNAMDKYESEEFEAGGYKWKLVLYPNGNKNKNVEDHISLYLKMVDIASLGFGWEAYAVFRLFLYNQNLDKYFFIQDTVGKESHFHPFKLEHGFDQFISLKDFNDISNGFLVEDTCVLGADVFVKKNTGNGECLSFTKDVSSVKHVWKIKYFSKIPQKFHESDEFYAGGQKWKLQLYPKGYGSGTGTHLSLFLALVDQKTNTLGSRIYASYTLRILDQLKAKHEECKDSDWFSSADECWGWNRMLPLDDLKQFDNGYLLNDECVVEAEVAVLGTSSGFDAKRSSFWTSVKSLAEKYY